MPAASCGELMSVAQELLTTAVSAIRREARLVAIAEVEKWRADRVKWLQDAGPRSEGEAYAMKLLGLHLKKMESP